MNRKFVLPAVLVVTLSVLIGWAGYMALSPNTKEATAKALLTEMHQVKSHDNYKKFEEKLTAIPTEGTKAADSLALKIAATDEYLGAIKLLTTENGYEQMVANRYGMAAGDFAAANGYLFQVKKITLKSSYSDNDKVQYEYTVAITAKPDNGGTSIDVTAEGSLLVARDKDGVFRVDAFKPYNQSPYMVLLSK